MAKTPRRPRKPRDPALLALSSERQAIILEAIRAGLYLQTACDLAGISVDTIHHWRKRVEANDRNAQALADFFGALKKASAGAEKEALAKIRRGDPGWQGSAWYLERRHYQRWGKREPQTRTAAVQPIRVVIKGSE